ncbi:MAG: hypothetical protein UR91_C0008G0010 [Candidatus Nomurabacteria bacterium GW2011_GWC2_35_8]|uniref:Serine protease n=1 Tax=Candidatus Nomurabacteria bacterium GW2011_GWC2_35_8 TaxID=1618752 RepID=A0A0G0D470_9BACT|nr:MAG: hypothetical protein UR91_C0008G0010 [Candidatus Nomurabacteria bacterium GW2011_GWC2_35_8]
MDIKDLNKAQLILLAVLLSFVTSIVTGITTVTLMQQAPASFTVPVNRVIRQTVEKIQQVEGKTTVQTVIVKEEDLVVDALAKNKSAVFFVSKEILGLDGLPIEVSVGKGFAVSSDGIVVVDGASVFDKGIYFVKNDSGKFKAEFVSIDNIGFAFLKIGAPLDEKNKVSFTVPNFGDLEKIKIGQKILISGNTISSFIFDGNKDINISVAKSNSGSIVLNLDGDVLGMVLSEESSPFVSIDVIVNALNVINGENTLPATPVLAPITQ